MTSTEIQTFAEQLAANAPHEFYGVKVMWIGENGEVLVLGHPGKRRALAAANRLARVDAQLTNLFDDWGALWDWAMVRELWATPAHTTGCKYVEAFRDWCDNPEVDVSSHPPVVEHGDRITPEQDCDCASKGDGEWYIRYDGTAEGAFPVTEIDPGF